ncbi:hypothetical protein [Dyella sp.]|uniref:hypothetical protein n=1 Tax=Dyella sp. TaxID=1869338 RepID=UPI0028464BA2|nr:hypothetical protein [Dyella sp.]MDR3444717.1 hypothetical protein [Dyella sp.]
MIKAGLTKLGMTVAAAMLLATGCAFAADAPSTGLGAPWPNAQDVSRDPSWHVYVFARDGVKYIQVNDANGVVRGGVAASSDGSTTMALPLGLGQVAVSGAAPSNGAVIYDDGATAVTQSAQGITAAPSSATFRAADCTSVADCSKLNN